MINKILCYFFGHQYKTIKGTFSCYIKRSESDWNRESHEIDIEECERCKDTKVPVIIFKPVEPESIFSPQVETGIEWDAKNRLAMSNHISQSETTKHYLGAIGDMEQKEHHE